MQISGLDERISIFSSLSRIGTAAVVAPRWKIDVELALPVLDDAICAFLNGAGLAAAVQAAAAAAVGRGVPLWQAYAFVVEGAWQ